MTYFHGGYDVGKGVLEQDRMPLPLLLGDIGWSSKVTGSSTGLGSSSSSTTDTVVPETPREIREPETVLEPSAQPESTSYGDRDVSCRQQGHREGKQQQPSNIRSGRNNAPLRLSPEAPFSIFDEEQQSPSTGNGDISLPSDFDYQALFDSINPLDGPADSLFAEDTLEGWDDATDSNLMETSPPASGGSATAMDIDLQPDNEPTAVDTAKNETDVELRCWDHGCNGKKFSNRSNLLRHQFERGKARPNFRCPLCSAYFSRTTARNQHVAKKSCTRVRRYSNGRERPRPRVIDD